MPNKISIEINPSLFNKLDKIADFIGDNVHNFSESILSHIVEQFEEEPYNDLSFWLSEKDLLNKIFNK